MRTWFSRAEDLIFMLFKTKDKQILLKGPLGFGRKFGIPEMMETYGPLVYRGKQTLPRRVALGFSSSGKTISCHQASLIGF
jgi:hypothetical protein